MFTSVFFMFRISFDNGMRNDADECNCEEEENQVCKTCVNELVQRILLTGVSLPEAAQMIDMELWVMEIWR